MTVQPITPRPGYVVRAEQARAEAMTRKIRRTPNNPWIDPVEPPRITYSDPTAEQAIANVLRERRGRR